MVASGDGGWFEERVEATVRAVLDRLPLDVALTAAPPGIELAVEGLFRLHVPERWAGWPPEWTTDGMVADLTWRPTEDTLAVAGRLWVDFTGRVITVLGRFSVAGDRVVARAHVGDVDPQTGRAASFTSGCLLLDGSTEGGPPEPHRTDGRRLVPVAWTEVAVIEAGDA